MRMLILNKKNVPLLLLLFNMFVRCVLFDGTVLWRMKVVVEDSDLSPTQREY